MGSLCEKRRSEEQQQQQQDDAQGYANWHGHVWYEHEAEWDAQPEEEEEQQQQGQGVVDEEQEWGMSPHSPVPNIKRSLLRGALLRAMAGRSTTSVDFEEME